MSRASADENRLASAAFPSLLQHVVDDGAQRGGRRQAPTRAAAIIREINEFACSLDWLADFKDVLPTVRVVLEAA